MDPSKRKNVQRSPNKAVQPTGDRPTPPGRRKTSGALSDDERDADERERDADERKRLVQVLQAQPSGVVRDALLRQLHSDWVPVNQMLLLKQSS